MRKILFLSTLIVFLSACGSGVAVAPLTIDQPSADELTFAEKRDFYVLSFFPESIARPGDIKIQLYRGTDLLAEPIREIQSHVDNVTCTTPASSLKQNYDEGSDYGITMVPDLIEEPGGFLDPNNKVIVTNDYYAGVILGGASKYFDTNYTDADGEQLTDLTAGTYTIVVTGLSCSFVDQTVTKQIQFGLTHASLGRFSPASSLAKLTAFTQAQGYRSYFNLFPGYFSYGGNLYEIKNRWMPNNAIEVVNDLTGTVIDNEDVAENDALIYNIKESTATNSVELAAIVRYELLDSSMTTLHHYDIGEPTITYINASSESVTVDGAYTAFIDGAPLVLTRAEVQEEDASVGDNLYTVGDTTPKTLDLDLSDGITIGSGEEFNIFGVAKVIPSSVSAGAHNYEFTIDNRISEVQYVIKDSDGDTIQTVTKEINLARIYDSSDPTSLSYSIYEFMHEFTISEGAGTYTVELVGIDSNNTEVAGTLQSFEVTVSS